MEDENWTDGHDLFSKTKENTIGVSKISERTYICSTTMWGSLWHFDNLKNSKTSQIRIDRNWVCSHQSKKEVHSQRLINPPLERFSNDCWKTKTKSITPTNHDRGKQRDEPIIIPSNYLKLARSAGKITRTWQDWFWFCFSLAEKLARVF